MIGSKMKSTWMLGLLPSWEAVSRKGRQVAGRR